jgi:hypothetical protein
MKVTKDYLKNLIKEEMQKAIEESEKEQAPVPSKKPVKMRYGKKVSATYGTKTPSNPDSDHEDNDYRADREAADDMNESEEEE